jgi:hypothetical protein
MHAAKKISVIPEIQHEIFKNLFFNDLEIDRKFGDSRNFCNALNIAIVPECAVMLKQIEREHGNSLAILDSAFDDLEMAREACSDLMWERQLFINGRNTLNEFDQTLKDLNIKYEMKNIHFDRARKREYMLDNIVSRAREYKAKKSAEL